MKILFPTIAIFFCVFAASGQNANVVAQEANASGEKAKDRPVKLLNRPAVQFPQSCRETTGLAKLKVTLNLTGKVTDAVVVLSSGCSDFDEATIRAAHRIKFKPAIKDGEPVTKVVTFEYNYKSN